MQKQLTKPKTNHSREDDRKPHGKKPPSIKNRHREQEQLRALTRSHFDTSDIEDWDNFWAS